MFHADATTIRVAATRVADLGKAAGDAERYADTWTPVPSDATGEIFRNFRSTVTDVTAAVAETLDHLRRATAGTADELFLTATHYEATDQESAARSDAQLDRLDATRDRIALAPLGAGTRRYDRSYDGAAGSLQCGPHP